MSPAQLLKGYTLRDNLLRYETPQVPGCNCRKKNSKALSWHQAQCETVILHSNLTNPWPYNMSLTKEWSIKGKIIRALRSYEVKCRNGNIVEIKDSSEQHMFTCPIVVSVWSEVQNECFVHSTILIIFLFFLKTPVSIYIHRFSIYI